MWAHVDSGRFFLHAIQSNQHHWSWSLQCANHLITRISPILICLYDYISVEYKRNSFSNKEEDPEERLWGLLVSKFWSLFCSDFNLRHSCSGRILICTSYDTCPTSSGKLEINDKTCQQSTFPNTTQLFLRPLLLPRTPPPRELSCSEHLPEHHPAIHEATPPLRAWPFLRSLLRSEQDSYNNRPRWFSSSIQQTELS